MRPTDTAPALVRAAAIALGLLGAAVVVGWTFDIDALKSVLPGANSMKFNTALGFLLSATALWFAVSPRTDRIANAARRWAPMIVAVLGALALVEYATNIDLGIDQLVFRDDAAFDARGRMSIVTAVAFILFASTFWIPRTRTTRNNTVFLALTTAGFSIATLAAIGYLFALPLLYRPTPASAIAVHTAIGLVIAFCGAFAMRPDIGWIGLFRSHGATGVFGRQVLPTVIIVPLALGWLALLVQRAGWLDGRTSLALYAVATMAILAVIVGRAGRTLGGMETTLKQREQVYQAVTSNALDAFILADGDGRILDWNPQAERMFGWRADEVLGKITRDIIMPPETRAGHAAGLERFKQEGAYEFFGRRVEVDAVRRSGNKFRAELIAIPIRRRDDLFFALFVRDVTELRAAEEQLRQAQKMDAVGRLTGGIAHDFNNTLTAIVTMLDSVLPRAPDNLKPRIEIALNAADRAAVMIKQLMAFSRKQVLQPTRVDVNDTMERISEILRRTLGERVQIELRPAANVPDAMVDASQVESAILNLSINARDAMPDGGKLTIETGLAELDAAYASQNLEVVPGHYVMIAVSDTGAGMSTETLQRAFEPFFTTKAVDRGTGLGLSMVHGFVKQSGGHVKIYSELGHGTTVRLYLPLADVNEIEQPVEEESAAVRGGSETILLVEDNPLVRASAYQALRDLGYTLLAATNGREALTIIEAGTPIDLLFTDVIMPEITGVQLADAALKLRPHLRILFTSGYTDHSVTLNGRLKSGANFLSKPYRTRDLAARVRLMLDEEEARDTARAG